MSNEAPLKCNDMDLVTRVPRLSRSSLVLRVIALLHSSRWVLLGDGADADEPPPDVYHHPNCGPSGERRGTPRMKGKRNNLLSLDQMKVDLYIS